MSDDPQNKLRTWQLDRRAFIEHRVFWRGHVGLGDLMGIIGLSRAQASKDINGYIRDHPDNIIYDKSARTYVKGPAFAPRYTSLNPAAHLDDLLALSNGASVPRSDWIAYQPDILATAVPARGVRAQTVRDVLRACEHRKCLEVTYQSMSARDPGERVIAPHALAHDGFRWHARAFCYRGDKFKDFVLGRILESKLGDRADVDPERDRDWRESVTLRIAPHPELSDNLRRIVELDYDMTAGIAEIEVRKCLLFYNLKRLGLDIDPSSRRAQDQHIVLANPQEVRSILDQGHR